VDVSRFSIADRPVNFPGGSSGWPAIRKMGKPPDCQSAGRGYPSENVDACSELTDGLPRMTTPARPRRNRATRSYHRTGAYPVSRALPFLVERVKDPSVADDALTPLERGARAWRGEVLHDLGGPEAVSAAKLALVEAALGDEDRARLPRPVPLRTRKHRRAGEPAEPRNSVA
jgi:hypothetical protein